MRLSPQSLARSSSRHPWRTVGIWVVLMVAAGVASGALMGDATTTGVTMTNNPEATQALELLEDRLTGPNRDTEIVIVRSESASVDDAEFRTYVEALAGRLDGLGQEVVQETTTFYESQDPGLVSEDRRSTLIPTTLAGEIEDAPDKIDDINEAIDAGEAPGFDVKVFGPAALGDDFNTVAEEDLAKGEGVGIMAALVILVVVFGAVVAGLVPIIVGVASIFIAVGVVAVIGQLVQFSFFVTNMISMMGLAVGIDYSLFVVSRYREERQRGRDKLDAIEAVGATASRAVFFSGMTVVLALLGMILIPNSIFKSLGAGAIFVVVISVAASLTLLPAILGLLGDKVNALTVHRRTKVADPEHRGGFWDAVTRGVMGRPVLSLVIGVGILLAAGSSALDMRTGFAGVSTVPDELPSKQAFDLLARDFPGGLSSPVKVVVDGDVNSAPVKARMDDLQAALAGDQIFGAPQVQVNDDGDLALITVPLNDDPSSKASTDAIGRLRDDYVPAAFPEGSEARVLVGGDTAFNKDFFDVAARYLPIVFVFVLGLSFVLLTIAFRSVVVPVKAIIMNLLSVGAAYGLIVLVCQKGVGNEIFGFQQVEVIEAWLPLFLFSVLFGLSMDYHVFLLSRIREHYDLTGDNTESVAYGLRTTAGIITGAALIMVAVFGGFAAGRMVAFEQMGFGLGVAVLIDATIVRSILVPASMKLLGKRNWYLPGWLQWLPNLGVEGPASHLDLRDHTVAPAPASDGDVDGDGANRGVPAGTRPGVRDDA
jgi:RND superfamily putative drug exporter